WPWVVWASTLQFPSNGEAIADGVEQMVAEAAARAMAQIRLPMSIMGVLLFDFVREFRWFRLSYPRSPSEPTLRVLFYRPGFKPNTQRLDPSGRRQMVTWPSGGATGIASSNGTNSPSIIQPVVVDDARV